MTTKWILKKTDRSTLCYVFKFRYGFPAYTDNREKARKFSQEMATKMVDKNSNLKMEVY